MAERRARPEDHSPEAEAKLDPRAQALQDLLTGVLASYDVTHDAVIDIPAIAVKPEHVSDICRLAKDDPRLDFKMLLCLAGVDYKEYLQVVYILLSLDLEQKLLIKTDLSSEDPHVPSVSGIWRAAEWYEREAHDLYGIVFDGHPGLEPLVLYEGFEGFPARKDFPFHDYQEF